MAETENPMRQVRIEKVVVNIGVGEAGERLIQAEELLQELTGRQPVRTTAGKKAAGFGIRRGQEVGVKVTLRRDKAEEFLDEALFTRAHRLPGWAFDDNGNVSFGVDDHTDFEKMSYDPDVGIFGLDVTVVLERPGKRVEKRRIRSNRVGDKQRVHWEDAMDLMEDEFDVEVI
ncbi:50S ribosomal protein L5 [Thermoplasmatales archaeon SW_10_69_26]|jgi:large subunit ribosomal protein L5|nr:MAG: 50S ribosomal protein L5 [Thermoplasmatales archaeon SW_10_69_26]